MFTETSLGKSIGEIKENSSMIELDLVAAKLSVSMVPNESSYVRTDGSSANKVTPDASGADLLSAFDSISISERPEHRDDAARDSTEVNAFDSIGKVDLSGQIPYQEKFDNKLYSFNSAATSMERDGEAAAMVQSDETCKPSHPLIVYTSSRRSAHNSRLDQNNETLKPPRSYKRKSNKKPVLNFTSLQISRRRRSLLATRTRSSWGFMGNIIPGHKENVGLELNFSKEKLKRVRGGQGSGKSKTNQKGRKLFGKTCTLSGPISLKIKIGNQICGLLDVTKNSSSPDIKSEEEVPRDAVLPSRKLEDVMSSDGSVSSINFDVRDVLENSCLSNSNYRQLNDSHPDGHNLEASVNNRSSDPGTSPDSEVINSIPDCPLFQKVVFNVQDSSIVSNDCVSRKDDSCLNLCQNNYKKGKRKDKLFKVEKLNAEEPTALGQKVGSVSSCNEASVGTVSRPCLDDTIPSTELLATESSNLRVHDTLPPCTDGRNLPKCSRANGRSPKILDLPGKRDKASKKKGNQNKKGGKHKVGDKSDGSGILNRVECHLHAGNQISVDFGETGSMDKGPFRPTDSFPASLGVVRGQYVSKRNAWVLCDQCEKWRRIPATLADQIEETNCGWTCKDNTDKDFADCSVPQEKSDAEINVELEISDDSCEEDTCNASLKSNQNRAHVTVSQQSSWSLIKSNMFLHRSRKTQTVDEVMVCHCKPPSDVRMGCGSKCLNRMLNIECVRGTCPCGELCSNQQFQRRKYAKLKWFKCGKKGHGLQALEDISEGQFLIEYVGEVLDVHTYQARQREYALKGHRHFYFMTLNGSEVIDASAKGNLGRFINHSCDPNCRTEKWMVNGEVCVGLFAVKDIKKGEEVTFDYNYVRVFGAAAKKCVCGSLNCRGYIGGDPSNSEVIVQDDSEDECSEPLMICEDKELNDDWNDIMSNSLNERDNEIANESPEDRGRMNKLDYAVGPLESTGAHSSEALAESARGDVYAYSGGCLSNTVRQLDMDEEAGESWNRSVSDPIELESEGTFSQKHYSVKFTNISSKSDGTMNKELFSGRKELSLAQSREENSSCFAQGAEIMDSALHKKTFSEAVKSKSKLKYSVVGERKDRGKANPLTKTHHLSTSTKKGKIKYNIVGDKGTPDVDKSNAASHKSDNLPELFLNSHFVAVEEKLNELLDSEGGISKRKDASRGYLKLLFLTAASGNNGHGEAIQSNRDVSMILDALLKTKSRTVLVDVINKNGLQMLHNIMKQCRREFIKTPILRKLLKILEHMATREILKLEHITGGPPRPGVESFKDSILTLTEHADKQVHQSARSFRDKWIPRALRKNCCTERDDARMEYPQLSGHGRLSMPHDLWSNQGGKPSEAINCRNEQPVAASCTVDLSGSDPLSASIISGNNETKRRKRKSRWDNPAEDRPNPSLRTNLKCGDGKLNTDDDIPPGFSSPCNGPVLPSDASSAPINCQEREASLKPPCGTVSADFQQRYNAYMSTSYGIPYSIIHQFGVRAESSDGWTIAPGVPFHPFPPLPPYPRSNLEAPSSTAISAPSSEPVEKAERDGPKFVAHYSGQKHAITPDMGSPETNVFCATGRPDCTRGGNSYSMGRKYFRQQKWNNGKLMPPPWIRMRNGW